MYRPIQIVSLLAIIFVALGLSELSMLAEDKAETSGQGIYKTMYRQDIDYLGGYEKGKLLRVNNTDSLEAGLNQMSADGWELVAVEGGRTVPVSGPNNVRVTYPPVYIFRRSGR